MREVAKARALFALVIATIVSPTGTEGATTKLRCPEGSLPIPAGEFPIGTTRSQDYEEDEQPRRIYSLSKPYCLDRTEVTVARYEACARSGSVRRSNAFFFRRFDADDQRLLA